MDLPIESSNDHEEESAVAYVKGVMKDVTTEKELVQGLMHALDYLAQALDALQKEVATLKK